MDVRSMTRTEAAREIALQVVVFARQHQQPFDMTAVCEHISECAGGYRGEYLQRAARIANHKTVARLARQMARQTGDDHLIARES